MDILIDGKGDLKLDESGDIALTPSVVQKVMIRARWFLGEWRWDWDEGLPYFQDLLKKNPATEAFKSAFRSKILEVDEVQDVDNITIEMDSRTREAVLRFSFHTDSDTFREEVYLNG